MASDIKQKMIDKTALLLAKGGLEGTSFSDILKASGAPRGSLYHHFPGGKDELVLAAIASAGRSAMDFLTRQKGQPADIVASAFLDLWRTILERSSFSAGCAVLAVTVGAQTPLLRTQAGHIFREWRLLLAGLLTEGGLADERATAIAATLIAACEGAVALARAEGSSEPFELMAREQLAVIRAAMHGRP